MKYIQIDIDTKEFPQAAHVGTLGKVVFYFFLPLNPCACEKKTLILRRYCAAVHIRN